MKMKMKMFGRSTLRFAIIVSAYPRLALQARAPPPLYLSLFFGLLGGEKTLGKIVAGGLGTYSSGGTYFYPSSTYTFEKESICIMRDASVIGTRGFSKG
jgi:hypothetical protein